MLPATTLPQQLLCQTCKQTTRNHISSLRASLGRFSRGSPSTPLQQSTAQRRSIRTLTPVPQRLPHRPRPSFHRRLPTQSTTRLNSTNPDRNPNPSTTRDPPKPYNASTAALKSKGSDRGPKSTETTQTDFTALNVLGGVAIPSTSVDICAFDSFALDSGLLIGDGDGIVLVSGEAFVWRPWMAMAGSAAGSAPGVGGEGRLGGPHGAADRGVVVSGAMMRGGATESERTGGVLNAAGQFEVREEAWGVLGALWPRPDLLIIGTGRTIRPLAPATRKYLQSLGVRIEILDTRNAASQFNMLATERGVGEVAAAMVPLGFGSK